MISKAYVKREVLEKELLRKGVSKVTLAEKFVMSYPYLSQVLTGKRGASAEVRKKLMYYFDMEFDELFEVKAFNSGEKVNE